MPSTSFLSPAIAITPEMEAFFVAILLDHGTRPAPELYGADRAQLASQIAKIMDGHPALPPVAFKVKRSMKELGGKIKSRFASPIDDEWVYFTLKLGDIYLDWLYAAERLRASKASGL